MLGLLIKTAHLFAVCWGGPVLPSHSRSVSKSSYAFTLGLPLASQRETVARTMMLGSPIAYFRVRLVQALSLTPIRSGYSAQLFATLLGLCTRWHHKGHFNCSLGCQSSNTARALSGLPDGATEGCNSASHLHKSYFSAPITSLLPLHRNSSGSNHPDFFELIMGPFYYAFFIDFVSSQEEVSHPEPLTPLATWRAHHSFGVSKRYRPALILAPATTLAPDPTFASAPTFAPEPMFAPEPTFASAPTFVPEPTFAQSTPSPSLPSQNRWTARRNWTLSAHLGHISQRSEKKKNMLDV